MKKILLILSIFILSFSKSFAVSKEPVIEASFDAESAYIGDIIKYTVKAHLPDAAYLAVNKNIIFKNFETVNVYADGISGKPNDYVIIFELAAYKTGVLDLEPVGIAYVNTDGNKRMFFTPQTEILINSLLGENAEDIKDIKSLKKISMNPAYSAGIALVLIILIALIVLLIKDIRKNVKEETVIIDPQVQALIDLDDLLGSGIIKNGEPRVFYYRTAEILRTYISKKYGFNAMEMTSTELLKKLENIVFISLTRKDIKEYFKIFDLARYAGFKPSESSMIDSLEKTKEFIRKL
ncbi:MAG: hypothetical protein FWH43_06810 [Endomicrobia bacterium]|nr:hypothetical protein [Endomicrobiia bacterium]